MENQAIIQKQMQDAGFNVTTCGNCGDVVLHKIGEEDIKCPHCGFESEPCDFPDLYYNGWDGKSLNKKFEVYAERQLYVGYYIEIDANTKEEAKHKVRQQLHAEHETDYVNELTPVLDGDNQGITIFDVREVSND